MSERVISDPTVAGWELNPDTGYWMWAASGGSGGSIQDGDTEGQITTWDGTEWTPEGAVVVSGGNANFSGVVNAARIRSGAHSFYESMDLYNSGVPTDVLSVQMFNGNALIQSQQSQSGDARSLNFMTGQSTRMTIDADGNVYISGKLFVNGVEVGGGGFWVEETPGVIKYNGTAKATDLVAG